MPDTKPSDEALAAHAALKRLAERAPATPEVSGYIATIAAALPDIGDTNVAPHPLPLTDAEVAHDKALADHAEARVAATEEAAAEAQRVAEVRSAPEVADTSDGIVATAPLPPADEDGTPAAAGAPAPGAAPLADTSDGVSATAPVAPEPTATASDLDAMSKDELLAEAERREVDVPSGATKAEIREALGAA